MITQYKRLTIVVSLLIGLVTFDAWAHAEHDKARFIANSGLDQGQCDNPLRPCQTIIYGIAQAAKGDRLLLAAGDYDITVIEEILALSNTLVPISGGYNRFDHFNNQNPDTNITTLRGVPDEMVEAIRDNGFKIINDGKRQFSKSQIQRVSAQHNLAAQGQGAASCINGTAAGYRCHNMDLVSHVSLGEMSFRPGAANDIWGHVDLNTHTEYAIIGLVNGVAVFDLSNPVQPREVGAISGLNSSWRDIKVYQYFDNALGIWQAYAYVTIDSASDYVSIIDLNQLPNTVSLVTKDRAVTQAHNVTISNVDYSLNIPLPGATPTLQLVGAPAKGSYRSSFLSFSLANPKQLSRLASGDNLTNGYTHDGGSMRVIDSRKDSDCQTNGQPCTLFIDFNEKEINLWNATNPGQESKLSTLSYSDVARAHQYVHSGWWSEDKRYLFAHDEFDEAKAKINTTVRIFDLQSLTTPTQIGQWTGSTAAIDHNGFVRGNRYYMSNYTRGVTVLDITDPTAPSQAAFFDTYGPSDSASYNGAWGVYPFLPSGLIIVSDISGGLFVLRDKSLTVEQGTLSFAQTMVSTGQGQSLAIEVKRVGASSDASSVSVGYELLDGSALGGEDFTAPRGVLHWAGSSVKTQIIQVDIAPEHSSDEFQEQFYIRLFNPTKGATISSPHYLPITIEGKQQGGLISFEIANLTVLETHPTHQVKVRRNGSLHGEVRVDYQLNSVSADIGVDIVSASGSLVWTDGSNEVKSITLTIIDDKEREADETLSLSLTAVGDTRLGSNPLLTLTINDDERNTPPSITLIENFEINTNQTSTLSGVVVDQENDLLSYQWSQLSGSVVKLIDSDALKASFVAPKSATTLKFKLQVSDSRGGVNDASLTVTVKASADGSSEQSSGGALRLLLLIVLLGLTRRRSKR